LPTFEALLDLLNRAAGPDDEEEMMEEEDFGLAGLFRLPPDLEDVVPPSANALEPRRSKRIISVAGHYTTLAGISPRKARK
jgi:hypothetical protein